MKLIFHFALLGVYFETIDSTVIDELHDSLVAYFKSANYATEYNPLDKSHYLNEDPHLHDKDHESSTEDPHNKPKTKDDNVEDYDRVKQIMKAEEWSQKYKFKDDEVNPKQALEDEGDRQNIKDKETAQAKAKLLSLHRYKKRDRRDTNPTISQHLFRKDPVLNTLRVQNNFNQPNIISQDFKVGFRRKLVIDESLTSSSSSREMKDPKKEFHELWLHKKYEALNNSAKNRGDKVNMAAARPWGMKCGDPNQHDMPWGVCMLTDECEAMLRIYRGDMFCGRTQFICCGIQVKTYDTYQGFDYSSQDKSLSTDSDEKRDRNKTSKEKRDRKKYRERKKRRRQRNLRKRKIRKQIRKINKEISKYLKRQYKNGSRQQKRKTKLLKKFVVDLKKQYRNDRQSVLDLHANQIMHIDEGLMTRLKLIQKVNANFVKNATFMEVLRSGTMTKKTAQMLVEAYPELNEFLEVRRRAERAKQAKRGGGGTRRADGGRASRETDEVLKYDIEYGYPYKSDGQSDG